MSELIYRHTWITRLTHWITVLALIVLLMSGLQIFNAHPSLYWGKSSYDGRPPIFSLTAKESEAGELVGITRIFGRDFVTTGVLGASRVNGHWQQRGFPAWATIPSSQWLAMGRRWHLFFAWVFVINGLLYAVYSIATRHLSHDLSPTRLDLSGIGRSILDHLTFRAPKGDAAKRYNVLQKLSYLGVIFVVAPLIILFGLGMSPWLNSISPGWVDWFGGRDSVRTLHFVAAGAFVAFTLIHLLEVIVTGLWNNVRSMITGRFWINQR